MNTESSKRLSRQNWLDAAIIQLGEHGVDGIKVVVLARKLGATSGSFYWHFKGQPELLDCILEHWEVEQTDTIIEMSRAFQGPPEERILQLMFGVIENDAAGLDHSISVWAKRNNEVLQVFERTINKRFDHAVWMFRQAGFTGRQAKTRGRMMVAYLMGESSALLKSNSNWKSILKQEYEVLLHKPQ